jgi:hypothetical protein
VKQFKGYSGRTLATELLHLPDEPAVSKREERRPRRSTELSNCFTCRARLQGSN